MTVVDISLLPLELQRNIFYYLPSDLGTLCLKGHILVTSVSNRIVSLPSSMSVRLFLVGGGGVGANMFS